MAKSPRSRNGDDEDNTHPRRNSRSNHDDERPSRKSVKRRPSHDDDEDDDYDDRPKKTSRNREPIKKKASLIGIISLVKGFLSLPLTFIPVIGIIALFSAVIGLVEGVIGLFLAKNSRGKVGGGLPLAGTILNVVAVCVVMVWFIVGSARSKKDNTLAKNDPPKVVIEEQTKFDPKTKNDPSKEKEKPKVDPPKPKEEVPDDEEDKLAKTLLDPSNFESKELSEFGLFGSILVPKGAKIGSSPSGLAITLEGVPTYRIEFFDNGGTPLKLTKAQQLSGRSQVLEETADSLKISCDNGTFRGVYMTKVVTVGGSPLFEVRGSDKIKQRVLYIDAIWKSVSSYELTATDLNKFEKYLASVKALSVKPHRVEGHPTRGYDITLSTDQMDAEQAQHLSSFPHLRSLVISARMKPSVPTGTITSILSKTSTKEIILEGMWITDEMVASIKGGPQLKAVRIRTDIIHKSSYDLFERCPELSSFDIIGAPSANMPTIPQKAVNSLAKMSKLYSINLGTLKITKEVIDAISGLPTLAHLTFQQCDVRVNLKPLAKIKTLKFVSFSTCGLSTRDVDFLVDTDVETVHLFNNPNIVDPIILILVKMPNLKSVQLKNTGVTPDAYVALQRANPKLRIND